MSEWNPGGVVGEKKEKEISPEQKAKNFGELFAVLDKKVRKEKFSPETIRQVVNFEMPEEAADFLEEKEKADGVDASAREPIREHFARLKSGLLFVLVEKYSKTLINLSGEEKADMIRKTLEVVYQLRDKGGRDELAAPYIVWSARSLVSIKKQQDAKDIAISMVGKGGYDNLNYNFLFGVLKSDADYSQEKIFSELSQTNKSEKENDRQVKFFVITLTDLIGAEEAVKKINTLIGEHEGEENIQNNLRYARSFIVPNHTKINVEKLKDFYEKKIKFEEYKLNEQMNEQEVLLLKSLISKDEKTLEMGCGTGRLIEELAKDGYDISGFDFTPRHVDMTRKKMAQVSAEGKVFQGDWHNIKEIENDSLDVTYSLGRNILHDYSVSDQVQLFREAARILKPGGRFIFDTANREKATPEALRKVLAEIASGKSEEDVLAEYNGYEKMALKYGIEMGEREIRNFRIGSIYDSPNNEDFMVRYVYSNEDIEELAKISGFRVLKIERRPLKTGAGDENLYYVLEKN